MTNYSSLYPKSTFSTHKLSLRVLRLTLLAILTAAVGLALTFGLTAFSGPHRPPAQERLSNGPLILCDGGVPNGDCSLVEQELGSCPLDCDADAGGGDGGDGAGDDGGGGASCNNNGVCDPDIGEAAFNCGDCLSVCGDAICAPYEVDTCVDDCPVSVTCGDGTCSAFENADLCEVDCRNEPAVLPGPVVTEEAQETDEPEPEPMPTPTEDAGIGVVPPEEGEQPAGPEGLSDQSGKIVDPPDGGFEQTFPLPALLIVGLLLLVIGGIVAAILIMVSPRITPPGNKPKSEGELIQGDLSGVSFNPQPEPPGSPDDLLLPDDEMPG